MKAELAVLAAVLLALGACVAAVHRCETHPVAFYWNDGSVSTWTVTVCRPK